MSSLVEELQAEAIKPAIAASDLLRKALVVATKLEIREMQEWIRCELQGYRESDPVPAYRQLRGQVMMMNPVRGWVPVGFPTSEAEKNYSVRLIRDQIARIEALSQSTELLEWHFPPETENLIRTGTGFQLPVILRVSRSYLLGIIESAKNQVLDWALQLREMGILGEGLTFTQRERELAQAIHITGNVGVVGNVTAPANIAATTGTVSQSLDARSLLQTVETTRPHLASMPAAGRAEAQAQLDELAAEALKEKPDQSRVRSILRKVREAAGQITDRVIEVGVKAMVDRALGEP